MAITQAQADAQLALWLAASDAVSKGQSYSIAGRSLTRVDAEEIRKMINYWQNLSAKIGRGGIKARRVVPRDL